MIQQFATTSAADSRVNIKQMWGVEVFLSALRLQFVSHEVEGNRIGNTQVRHL